MANTLRCYLGFHRRQVLRAQGVVSDTVTAEAARVPLPAGTEVDYPTQPNVAFAFERTGS